MRAFLYSSGCWTQVRYLLLTISIVALGAGCGSSQGPDLGNPTTAATPTASEAGTPTPLPTTPPPTPTQPPTATQAPTPTATSACLDGDSDGYCGAGDCDDTNPLINPSAVEQCNTIDDNCNGIVDDIDSDGDGWFGCPGAPTQQDCDDANPAAWPGNFEACDGIDNDCDGLSDEGYDRDGDGYASCGTGPLADCNDNEAAVNPGAVELCNGRDDNCNGATDEGVKGTYYPDADKDGYGSSASGGTEACAPPPNYATEAGDCDDANPAIYPGAPEICDGVDNNCNGSIQDESPLSTFYSDTDGDGYGGSASITACAPPSGFTAQGGDCDDTESSAYPGAMEVCDVVDNDCDGTLDEGLGSTEFFVDDDLDGYGDPDNTVVTCDSCLGNGCAETGTDCNDNDDTIYPGAPEIPDGKDNNCDGEAEAAISLDNIESVITGSTASASFGATLSALGDVDGDGYDDFAMGAPKGGPSRGGQVFIVYGSPSRIGQITDGSAGTAFHMEQNGADFGTAIAGADLDGDGTSDIVIGAPLYDSVALTDAGIVWVIYSEASVRPVSGALTTSDPRTNYVVGLAGQVYMGSDLDGSGDIDGDGFADLLIGAPWPWISQIPPLGGVTFILRGKSGRYVTAGGINAGDLVQIYGEASQILGVTVAHAGDLDNNGYSDFVAVGMGSEGRGGSSYENHGITYVIGGGDPSRFPTGTAATLNASELNIGTYKGDTQGDMVGQSADGVGDVNNDGFADFMLGRQVAKSGEPLGMLFLGGPLPPSGNAEATADVRFASTELRCPCVVSALGDINADGIDDFAIGTPTSAVGGSIHIFYGQSGDWAQSIDMDSADLVLLGSEGGSQAGASIANIGDIDGDGHGDAAIGAPGAAGGFGAVYILYGG